MASRRQEAAGTLQVAGKMGVRPYFDTVIIRPASDKKAEKTAGGIVLPDSAREERSVLLKGTIVEVGPGKRMDSGEHQRLPYSVGENVVYYGGDAFEVNGETLHIVGSANIYCGLIAVQ